MARLDELWRSVDGPGRPPQLDSRRVKARVNAALDADQTERNLYMKQKLRTALIAAAAVAALTGSAFAATANWNGLSNWFKGDPAPVQEYVDSTVRSVSDENYTLTVEGCVADEHSAYLTVSITALSDEAKEFLWDDHFIDIDTFDAFPVLSSGETPHSWSGPGYHDLDDNLDGSTGNTRRFAMSIGDFPDSTTMLRVRCGYMEEGKQVEVPLAPAPSKTVDIGASGSGTPSVISPVVMDDDTLTISKITLTPFTCHFYGSSSANLNPNIRLRMADGSILTQSQVMDGTGGSFNQATRQWEYHYRFKEIQDLDGIASVIVFDMEYPLDGSKPTPVEHNPALDPITVTRMERLDEHSGYGIPVRELTEKLGGACTWDPATDDVTCVYRGVTVVLHAGRDTALVDGETVDLPVAPAEQDGVLAAHCQVFLDAWGLDGFLQRETTRDGETSTTEYFDFYIIP